MFSVSHRVTICLIGMLLISATVLELVRNYQKRPVGDKKDSLAMRGLHCFSLLSNISAITNTDSSVSDEISAMNGIRAINNIWLLAAHVGMETTHSSSTPKLQYEVPNLFYVYLLVVMNIHISWYRIERRFENTCLLIPLFHATHSS